MILRKLLRLNEIHSDEVRRMDEDDIILNDIHMIVTEPYSTALIRRIELEYFMENDLLHCINGSYFKQ